MARRQQKLTISNAIVGFDDEGDEEGVALLPYQRKIREAVEKLGKVFYKRMSKNFD